MLTVAVLERVHVNRRFIRRCQRNIYLETKDVPLGFQGLIQGLFDSLKRVQ